MDLLYYTTERCLFCHQIRGHRNVCPTSGASFACKSCHTATALKNDVTVTVIRLFVRLHAKSLRKSQFLLTKNSRSSAARLLNSPQCHICLRTWCSQILPATTVTSKAWERVPKSLFSVRWWNGGVRQSLNLEKPAMLIPQNCRANQKNNPYVHLRTERGVTKEEMRMALILDKKSGIPV